MKKIRMILSLSIVLLPHLSYAQTQQGYLYEVGEIDTLFSSTLNESREIYVQLPTGFDPAGNQKYPVAYILDGEVFLPAVSNVLEFYSGGFMPEMILVGISNRTNRMRDLTTSEMKTMYGRPFNTENGAADNFTIFIKDELIPYVEKKFPVTSFRTLIGHSYGGLFTIYTLIHHPELFDNYLAIDPSLDWDNQKLLNQSIVRLATEDYKGNSLFISMSGQLHSQNPQVNIDNVMQDNSDFTLFARSIITFSNLVEENEQNGLAFAWKFYPGELHGTIALPSVMDGLISLFDWYQMENTYRINSPETQKDELFSIIKHRATKLQDHFKYQVPPYPEELLNVLGYMSLDMQQPEKARLFFEFAIEYYPQSANAYDSMADYYESQKDYAGALKCVTSAYQLSGNESYKERIESLKEKEAVGTR